MDDLIGRQQTIDALMERFKRVPTNAIIAKDVIRKLPSVQPEQRWILCSERLPEAKQRVLVTFPDGTVDIKICIDAGHLKWFFAHMIAWMPLPEPYAEGREERI